MTNSPTLYLDGVSKHFIKNGLPTYVLSGITLESWPGECLWVRGESGSGKTSILRIAAGLSQPSSGDAFVLGNTLYGRGDVSAFRRRNIGMVFQDSNLLLEFTVEENLLIAAIDGDRHEILRLLSDFDLVELRHSKAKELSGGEAQRVAFCRALINEPALLLADEPTAGLDSSRASAVLEAMDRAVSSNCSVVVASHDPSMQGICDRVVRIEQGRHA